MILQYPMENENNYIYNGSYLTFSDSKCKLKKIYSNITGLSFYHKFNTLTADYGLGILEYRNLSKVTDPVDGKLDLTGYVSYKYVDYYATNNCDSTDRGAIRIKIIPNYSGNPVYHQIFFALCKEDKQYKSAIQLAHYSDGRIYLSMSNVNQIWNVSVYLGTWSPVQGELYELELNWDFVNNNVVKFFINGVQFGNTVSTSFEREPVGLLRIGHSFNINSAYRPNFYVDSFAYFSTEQHLSNYIPEDISDYYKGEITLAPSDFFRTDYLESVSYTGSENVRIVLIKNSKEYYYNNGQWLESDGSYSEANNPLDLTEEVLSSFITENSNVKWKIIFNSDGFTELYVDNIVVNYSFAGQALNLNTAIIYGYYYEKGVPVAGMAIKCKTNFLSGNDSSLIVGEQYYEDVTDNAGYWEIELVYENVKPDYLIWNFNGKLIKTNFIEGVVKFGELTQLSLYEI